MTDIISSGSYSKVYASGNIAVKVFLPGNLSAAVTEYMVMKLCKHKNIVSLLTYDFTSIQPSISMHKYDCDLNSLITKGVLTISQVYHITSDIINGLDYLHARGFIHCDIKPTNILVQLAPFTVVIADFSITCLQEEKQHLKEVQCILYRAPEVYKSRVYTTAIDIWSLGRLMIAMLGIVTVNPGKNGVDATNYSCNLLQYDGPLLTTRNARLDWLNSVRLDYIINTIKDTICCDEWVKSLENSKYIEFASRCIIPRPDLRPCASDLRIWINSVVPLNTSYVKPCNLVNSANGLISTTHNYPEKLIAYISKMDIFVQKICSWLLSKYNAEPTYIEYLCILYIGHSLFPYLLLDYENILFTIVAEDVIQKNIAILLQIV
jgi:serine/threonine protein kinase